MKTPPSEIIAARAANSSTLCKIWRIERRDGEVFGFTEHDSDLIVDAETYVALSAVDLSSIKTTSELNVDDLEAQGALESDLITEKDLLSGIWDGAAVIIGEVDWTQLDAGYDVLRWGWIGRVSTEGTKFVAELFGPTVKLQNNVGKLYQQQCRAQLGDTDCGVTIASHTQTGTVGTVTSNRVFTATGIATPADNLDPYWTYGKLTWTSGANDGLQMEVFSWDTPTSTLTLMLPMPFTVTASDTFSVTAGCDHYLQTCKERFNNVINFRGEPFVPVTDDVFKGPE